MTAKLPHWIVKIATQEIGVEEIDGTNSGPRVREYQAATDLGGTGWPWCAAFVCWVVREAAKAAGVEFTPTFQRPTTAGAWALENWSLRQDRSTWTRKPHGGDIEPGDIVIFNFSHVGFAVSAPDENGNFRSCEGNTDGQGSREGGAVLAKWRRMDQVRSRIRLRV